MHLANVRRQVDRLLGRYRTAKQNVEQEEQHLEEATQKQAAVVEGQKILQELAQKVQQEAHDRIAAIVSRCLETIFDEPYQFRILFEQKRGGTEARLVFVREGLEVDPMSAAGGGVVDVAGFALRLACLLLAVPPKRKVMVLDEPFKFLSAAYRSRVRDMLLSLAEDLGVQFIIVTHSAELKVGKVVVIESTTTS